VTSGERPDAHAFADYARRDPWLLLHKAVYLVLCVGWVCFMPFLPLYLASSGMSTEAVGVVLALRPLCVLCATPIFGALADRGYRRVVLVGSLVASSLCRAAAALCVCG
jgi:predicted MFS family arabinose efflux permease